MRYYKQLTCAQRCQIEMLKKRGESQAGLLFRCASRTPEEAALGGKIMEVHTGAVAMVINPPCPIDSSAGTYLDLLRLLVGWQAVHLSRPTTTGIYEVGAPGSAITASSGLPLGIAAAGGIMVGSAVDSMCLRTQYNSLGGDAYNLVHEGRVYRCIDPDRFECRL